MNTVSTFVKYIIRICLSVLICFILIFNFSLYYKPEFKQSEVNQETYNSDVYNQLTYLKSKLRTGAGNEMQSMFPEGFIFINALYGLSWSELIENQSRESVIYKEGIREISWVLKEIEQPKARSIFDKGLRLEYGAFYRGWVNYLRGKKIELQSINERDSIEVDKFVATCYDISKALKVNHSPFLESYEGAKWPADGVIAASSLALYNDVFKSDLYLNELEKWVVKIKSRLDIKTGLIPHSIDAESDLAIEGARGSSQSLLLIFLNDIDEEFANDQFIKYKTHFLDSRVGMPGIREYPKGEVGYGDIDSGPVILDIGGAASIVGQRTMATFSDWAYYEGLRNCIETFGVGMTLNSKKKYIFGQLPMADAFIAWSNSIEKSKIVVKQKVYWRLKTQLLSSLLILFFAFIIKKI